MQDAGGKEEHQSTRAPVHQDTRCKIQDAGCKTQDAGYLESCVLNPVSCVLSLCLRKTGETSGIDVSVGKIGMD